MKLVKDFMEKKVVCFSPNDSIFEVAKKFSKHNISGGPVLSRGKVIGVISEADIVRFIELKMPKEEPLAEEPHILMLLMASFVKEGIEFLREGQKLSKSKVKDFMSKEVISILPDATLLEAAEMMCSKKVTRLPVIDNNKLAGIIAREDLIRAMVR